LKASSEEIKESRKKIEAQSQITSKQAELEFGGAQTFIGTSAGSSWPRAPCAWPLVAAHAHGATAYEERSMATRTQETAAGGGWGTEWITTV